MAAAAAVAELLADAAPGRGGAEERAFAARPRLAREGAGARAAAWAGAFGLSALGRMAQGLAARDLALEWGADVNAVRLRGGRKEVMNGGAAAGADGPPADAEVTSELLERLYRDEGCTLQVHQPQRWNDRLWKVCAALEEELGCLAGCNAYITPPGQQGLAPHFDDVDLWVCQTEGSKHWRVYSQVGVGLKASEGPLFGRDLAEICATCSSGDLDPEQFAENGVNLLMEVTLQVGDVLYIPRGCVHQARAASGPDGGSCHVTISTHQRWCPGEALRQGLGRAMATAYMRVPIALRLPLEHSARGPGVPPSDLSSHKRMAILAAQGLRELADELEQRGGEGELSKTRTVLDMGIREMVNDFMASRLPPHPSQLPAVWEEPLGPDDRVAPIGLGLLDIHTVGRSYEPYAEDVPEELTIRIVSCRANLQEAHMVEGGGELGDAGGSDCEEAGEEGDEEDEDPEDVKEEDEDPEGGEGAEEAGFGLVEVPATEFEAVERVFFQPGGVSPGGVRIRDVYPGRPELGLAFCKMLFQHGLINTVARGGGAPAGDRPPKRARCA